MKTASLPLSALLSYLPWFDLNFYSDFFMMYWHSIKSKVRF